MRCPKCGYISFDHLETCLKCNKKIKGISKDLSGSVHKVAVPVFLSFGAGSEDADDSFDASGTFVDTEDMLLDDEISDPDLDILLDEDDRQDEEIAFELSDDEEDSSDEITLDLGQDFDLGLPGDDSKVLEDEEEGGISLDFGDFEFESDDLSIDEGTDDELPAPAPLKELPLELSDISDLKKPTPAEVVEDEDDLELSLDLDFGLDEKEDVVDESPGQKKSPAEPDEEESELEKLSLDDLDLSLDHDDPESKKKPADDEIEEDEELNFDLDLGDLDLDLK